MKQESKTLLLGALANAAYCIQKNPSKYGHTYDCMIQFKGYGVSNTQALYDILVNQLGVDVLLSEQTRHKHTAVRIRVTKINNLNHLFQKLIGLNAPLSNKVLIFRAFIELRVYKLMSNGKARYGTDENKLYDIFHRTHN